MPQPADETENVEIAGRIIGESAAGVKIGEPVRGQHARPRFERVDVGFEAFVTDEHQPNDEARDEQARESPRYDRFGRAGLYRCAGTHARRASVTRADGSSVRSKKSRNTALGWRSITATCSAAAARAAPLAPSSSSAAMTRSTSAGWSGGACVYAAATASRAG